MAGVRDDSTLEGMNEHKNIDTATVRRWSVEADVDPRSIIKRLRGEPVRGMSGHRIDRVLGEHGVAPGVWGEASTCQN